MNRRVCPVKIRGGNVRTKAIHEITRTSTKLKSLFELFRVVCWIVFLFYQESHYVELVRLSKTVACGGTSRAGCGLTHH
ncbi:MAG: hypothetical protein QOI77_1956 [Blastocatellia bacterium]|jgi:hypothetical protein|nr:hypothetical protein [Blastocatellia bacterium]